MKDCHVLLFSPLWSCGRWNHQRRRPSWREKIRMNCDPKSVRVPIRRGSSPSRLSVNSKKWTASADNMSHVNRLRVFTEKPVVWRPRPAQCYACRTTENFFSISYIMKKYFKVCWSPTGCKQISRRLIPRCTVVWINLADYLTRTIQQHKQME